MGFRESYAPPWSEKRTSLLKAIEKKGFKEERVTTMRLDAIGTSTTLESNKSPVDFVGIITGMMSRDRTNRQQLDKAAPCGSCMARHLVRHCSA
jgi:hypothetical protein